MLILFAFYNADSMKDCYSQSTQLNLYSNYLEILLDPLPNTHCDFPDGILIQLQFPDETLNIGQFYTKFDYNKTRSLIVNCTNCERYDEVISSALLIDSVQLTTIFSIGSILNVRRMLTQYSIGVNITYEPQNICIVINQSDVSKTLTDKTVNLTIKIDDGSNSQFGSFTETFTTDQSMFCFEGTFDIPYLKLAVLTISGMQDGILTQQNYTTSNLILPSQPNIISSIDQTVYPTYSFLNLERIEPDFQTFADIVDYSKASFVAKVVGNNKNYYISGPLSQPLFERNGKIICQLTDDNEECQIALQMMLRLPLDKRIFTIYFLVNQRVIAINTVQQMTGCFQDLTLTLSSFNLLLLIEINEDNYKYCQLEEKLEYSFSLGYYDSLISFEEGQDKLVDVFNFKRIWNVSDLSWEVPCSSKQCQESQVLRQQPFVGLFITNSADEFQNEIMAGIVQNGMATKFRMYMVGIVGVSMVISLVAVFISIIPKKKSTKKVVIKKVDELL